MLNGERLDDSSSSSSVAIEEIESKGREERKILKKREAGEEQKKKRTDHAYRASSTSTFSSASSSFFLESRHQQGDDDHRLEEVVEEEDAEGVERRRTHPSRGEWIPKEKEEEKYAVVEDGDEQGHRVEAREEEEVKEERRLERRRVVDLEAELERRDALVDRLARELESTREAHAASEAELHQVTHTLLPLAESLRKMQEQLDERDVREAHDRAAIEQQFTELVEQLEAARNALRAKDEEVHRLQNENHHLKGEIERRLRERAAGASSGGAIEDITKTERLAETSTDDADRDQQIDSDGSHLIENGTGGLHNQESDVGEDDERDEEETIGEAAGPPVRPLDDSATLGVVASPADEPTTTVADTSAEGEDKQPSVTETKSGAAKDKSVDEEADGGAKDSTLSSARKSSDPLDSFKVEMEREFQRITDSFQSAEQFSEMFSRKTLELTSNITRIKEVRELEKEKVKLEQSLTKVDNASEGADDAFVQKVKSWPRDMVEKQLLHYRDAYNAERKSLEEMEEEKFKIEEELMSVKLELEQKQLEVTTLQSGKEQLEQYVAQLAEEMEKETSQMVSMKEQFQTETLKFNPDFSAYLTSDDESEAAPEAEDTRSQTNSELTSPAVSPITPRARGEEGPNARMRDISKRRSLNLDLTMANGALASSKGKIRLSPRRSGPMSSSSSTGHLSTFRSEDDDTGTEGMYSEDERESSGADEIIGKYREEVSQLREELRTVREELEHARQEKEQNGTEMRAQMEDKDARIRLLEDELRKQKNDYETFSRRTSELEEESQSAMREIDGLKKELFYSLAVAIKLNLSLQGRKCNLSISSLYETASTMNKHHSEWSEWILQQLMDAEEPPEPARGFRTFLMSSGRSSIRPSK